MSVTKAEWSDWKLDNITRAFYAACEQRVEDAKDILASSAGLDPVSDNFYRGFIAAYAEMVEFKVEDVEDDD